MHVLCVGERPIAFEHGFGSALDERLGFSQTQTCLDLADGLDGANLVGSGFLENHVEGVLDFSRSGGGGTSTSSGDSHGGGSSHAPLAFQLLHEVGGFQNGQRAQIFYQLCDVSHVTFL